MLFNSIDFAVFLPLVFMLYWFVFQRNLRLQNAFLVAASYLFYGWWDWRFLLLILFSTLVDFFIGRRLGVTHDKGARKGLLFVSIAVNLGLLGFFKYYNFFVDNFQQAFTLFGSELDVRALSIVLPVGISFYTFQTLSYTIDVYRRQLPPCSDLVSFAAFVTFFPQLVAGPIERATHLLPQFYAPRKFDYAQATDGLRQMLWGFFKKVVIADNCATVANEIFNNSGDYSGSTLVVGAVFFAFQIYGDFSGYSDIAIGTSRLFGFDLMQNFRYPYFSRDIAEFWRRWHISLSTWFRDYLYIPLGGSRGGNAMRVRNTFIIFLVSGFWHGANWTFVVWGLLHAVFFLPLLLGGKNRKHLDVVAGGRWLPSLRETTNILLTFSLVTVAWIFFRADNLTHALQYIQSIFTFNLFTVPDFPGRRSALVSLGFVALLLAVEWNNRERQHGLASMGARWPMPARLVAYYSLAIFIMYFGNFNENAFIYFQF